MFNVTLTHHPDAASGPVYVVRIQREGSPSEDTRAFFYGEGYPMTQREALTSASTCADGAKMAARFMCQQMQVSDNLAGNLSLFNEMLKAEEAKANE